MRESALGSRFGLQENCDNKKEGVIEIRITKEAHKLALMVIPDKQSNSKIRDPGTKILIITNVVTTNLYIVINLLGVKN